MVDLELQGVAHLPEEPIREPTDIQALIRRAAELEPSLSRIQQAALVHLSGPELRIQRANKIMEMVGGEALAQDIADVQSERGSVALSIRSAEKLLARMNVAPLGEHASGQDCLSVPREQKSFLGGSVQ